MYHFGLDIGSRTSKIVVLQDNVIVFQQVVMTGLVPADTAENLIASAMQALMICERSEFQLIATGYGRNAMKTGYKTVSEINCHAKGVNYFFPEAEMVIDIGGQDSKGILVGKNGKVLDFVMNDRCAAGSGRFLEKLAEILGIRIDELGLLVQQSQQCLEINSTCVVFAESEIIGLIAQGISAADIASGVHEALARRIRNLVAQFRDCSYIIFTGGVARNDGMKQALEKIFNREIFVPADPVITGALGAALLAKI
jgi:predicted CoA-substrate-specific enzyme activase